MPKPLPLYAVLLAVFASTPVMAQTISAAPNTLETITVTGDGSVNNATPEAYAGGQVARGGQAGILGNLDMMDMPFTQTSYTSKLIQDQQARTLGDVLKNDPSVQVGNGFGNQAETFVIRGLALNNDDLSFNGLYGILPRQILPIEMVERVEVFKGASAFLNGAAPGGSGVGGLINIQPKRAGDDPLTRLNLDYTGPAHFGGGVDIGRRWGEDNRFGIRVNAAQHDGDISLHDADMRSTVGTVGLDFRGDGVRASLDAGYQKIRFDQPLPTVRLAGDTAPPAAPSTHTNYGQPWSYTDLESTFGVARLEYDITRNWTTYAAAGMSRDNEHGDYAGPFVGANGEGTVGLFGAAYRRDTLTGEVGLRGEFDTGSVGHRVNLAYSALNSDSFDGWVSSAASPTNLYDEAYIPRPAGVPSAGDLDTNLASQVKLRSFAVADTLSLFEGDVLLTLGARHQSIVQVAHDAFTPGKYDESATTPVLGLVLRPWDSVSLYANRIEGLTQGGRASNDPSVVDNPGATLGPIRSKQTELGIKVDFESYGGSLGVFQIEKPEVDVVQRVYGIAGKQRNRGVELNLYGEPLSGWRVLGGVTYMDARLIDTPDGALDNHRARGVPRFQGTLSTEWDVPTVSGLTLQASLIHRGAQYTSSANTYEIPSWTRVDLGAVYRSKIQGRNVTYRAGVDNVADRRYWATVAPQYGQLTQGRGRTFKLSMSVDF